MTEFIAGFAPILVIWTIPLAPMIYAAVAATVEGLTEPVHGDAIRQVSAQAGTAVGTARAEVRHGEENTADDRLAA